jgi:phospholipid/cholesterol/gamma-HCH transport system substrate-binding protein
MDERVAQFRLGVVVLATLIVGTIMVLLFVKVPSLVTGTKTIYFLFPEAPGVSTDTPVRKSGILVGRVNKVELVDDGVLVTAGIEADKKITASDVPFISGSLLGDAKIEFVPGPTKSKEPLPDGDMVRGEVAPDLMRVVTNLEGKMGQTIIALGDAGDEVAQLAHNINNMLGPNDEQFNRIISKTDRALDSFQRAMDGIGEIVGDPKMQADLKRGLTDMPQVLRDTQQTLLQMQSTMKLAEKNLQNVEGFTKPLGEKGGEIITSMNSSVSQLDRLLTQLADLSQNLNSREGSIGQLLNNPHLYQQLESAAGNLNDLTRDLKPVVADARVFTDKIARHPEVFTRGIISPSSGIKGISPALVPTDTCPPGPVDKY